MGVPRNYAGWSRSVASLFKRGSDEIPGAGAARDPADPGGASRPECRPAFTDGAHRCHKPEDGGGSVDSRFAVDADTVMINIGRSECDVMLAGPLPLRRQWSTGMYLTEDRR